ncbi:sensor histidine kinase [Hwanghaeella sp.]|uniref:sensor histidine kinase n=1 Tax=Hwanghaeella sp. TaxID=2605943 RepID=UPI003CCBF7D3
MRLLPELRLRTSVVLLQFSTIIITLAVVGSALLAYVITEFSRENLQYAGRASETMATRVETFLADLTREVILIGEYYESNPGNNIRPFLQTALQSRYSAIFIVGSDSRLKLATLAGANVERENELEGVDLSAYPLLKAARAASGPTWSDKHISAITGAVTVGLAIPLDGEEAMIVEVPLDTIVAVGNVFRDKGHLDYWIIDSKGEVVADTSGTTSQLMNLANLEIVQAGFAGVEQPEQMTLRGKLYNVSASYSDKLGWLFVGRVPAGLANPDLREIIYTVLAFALGTAVFGLLLAPFWVRRISKPVGRVTELARQIAAGKRPTHWPHGGIEELNTLSDHLKAMSDAISKREEELRDLNEGLEARVADRTEELTKANEDLRKAVVEIEQARDELLQSEKVAALGRMVAGISHELNTPLGNGRMAVSTLAARLETFQERLANGARQQDLDKFLETVAMSVEIAENNLIRASDLVRSFKEISADRTASRRRKVVLKELLDEVALTLTPLLKKSPATLEIDAPTTIWVDSYPGELGQIVSNLVENATIHAFKERDSGKITIKVEQPADDTVTILVKDDGNGMTPEVVRKAFDPFFTTALGQGGTGLGLYIVHKTVGTVLGGTIALKSKSGQGTAFTIRIPVVAPASDTNSFGEILKVG